MIDKDALGVAARVQPAGQTRHCKLHARHARSIERVEITSKGDRARIVAQIHRPFSQLR